MKKIMFALAAMAFAVVAQATSVKWSTSTALFMGNDTDTFNGTMYLIDAATIDSAALATALKGGDSITKYAVASATATDGKIAATTINPLKYADGTEYGVGSVNFYTVAIQGDQMFASAAKSVALSATGTPSAAFALKTQSTSAGTWTSVKGDTPSDTPEPTSGLLLLVGGAMLALRRKQK